MIESRLEGQRDTGLLVVDLVGGPGGEPYHVSQVMTEKFMKKLRKSGRLKNFHGAIAKDVPHYQLMRRGFTIASVGYWGTRMRTLNEPNEIELAVRDVRLVINYYRKTMGEEPPLITASLGNHLVLGAIGKHRLENANVLALVPVMDGLQQDIKRFRAEVKRTGADNKPSQVFRFFNIYARSDKGVVFDHWGALLSRDFTTQFIGDLDYRWRDVSLTASCSKLILGSEDPRTEAYLAANNNLPSFIEVWQSDHDVTKDVPDQTRAVFAAYAECLLSQKQETMSDHAN